LPVNCNAGQKTIHDGHVMKIMKSRVPDQLKTGSAEQG
jgi:hypothetical protein